MSLANTANMDILLISIRNASRFKFEIAYKQTQMETALCVNKELLQTIMSAVEILNARKKTANTACLLTTKRPVCNAQKDSIFFKLGQRMYV